MNARMAVATLICVVALATSVFVVEHVTGRHFIQRLAIQSQFLSTDVWELKPEETEAALERILLVEGLESAEVRLRDGSVFASVNSDAPPPGVAERGLKAMGLLRRVQLTAEIRHGDETLGRLGAVWLNRNGYAHLAIALILLFSVHLYYAYRRRIADETRLRDEMAAKVAVQERLRENQRFLSYIFQAMDEGVAVIDRDMKIVQANPAIERMYDGEPPITGKTCNEVFHHSAKLCESCPARATLTGGTTGSATVPLNRSNGEQYGILEISSFPLKDRAEQPELAVLCARNVTTERELQRQLQHSEKMAAIGRLSSGIARDFSNLLTPVMGYAELIKERLTDRELSELVGKVIVCARRGADLARKMVGFTWEGKEKSGVADVHSVISETASILSHSIDPKITIQKQLVATRHDVQGDEDQLQSALLNLALNAQDAMPDGGTLAFATLVANLSAQHCAHLPFGVAPGEYLCVTVGDTGVGMEADTLSKAFEPFFTTKAAGEGYGMGLASVYGTIERHGGTIEIDSTKGEGTTISIYLPLCSDKPMSGDEPGDLKTGSAAMILVIDEEASRESITGILESLGNSVIGMGNVNAALEYFRVHWNEVNLIILDHNMPKMETVDTLRALREIDPDAKVLVTVGSALDTRQGPLSDEASALLHKPFTRLALRGTLDELLRIPPSS